MPKTKKNSNEEASKGVLGALPAGMREELDSCDTARLKTHIVQSTAILRANKKAMKLDVELESAKERVKELSSDYKETEKTKEAIISYALHLLGEKGSPDLLDIDD